MASQFFAGLLNGNIRMPDSAINYGNSPLPVIPPGAAQFTTPDGRYNVPSSLLPGGLERPYAYGTSARISTQTQMAHPNRVQLVIPKLCIPAPESDGLDNSDPILQHAISDGDLAFSFRMGLHMAGYGSAYCIAPYGFTAKAVQLINLATVNYILWGLQIGVRGPKSTRWRAFFNNLTKIGLKAGAALDEQAVWNFIRTYLRPFGVQHGGDQQGGMHEGDDNRIVTHGAVDYVSSFAIEGKLRHVNNLWRDYDVRENDDLVLALRYKRPPHSDLQFALSSSVRATRNERVSISGGYYYLRPEVLQYRSYSDVPYIHIGRSQLYCSAFTRGLETCCWDARMPVTPGAPLLLTFEPNFVDSDKMFYAKLEIEEDDEMEDVDRHLAVGDVHSLKNPRSTGYDEAKRVRFASSGDDSDGRRSAADGGDAAPSGGAEPSHVLKVPRTSAAASAPVTARNASPAKEKPPAQPAAGAIKKKGAPATTAAASISSMLSALASGGGGDGPHKPKAGPGGGDVSS